MGAGIHLDIPGLLSRQRQSKVLLDMNIPRSKSGAGILCPVLFKISKEPKPSPQGLLKESAGNKKTPVKLATEVFKERVAV